MLYNCECRPFAHVCWPKCSHAHWKGLVFFLNVINIGPCFCRNCCIVEFWVLRVCQNGLVCTAPSVLWPFLNWSADLTLILPFTGLCFQIHAQNFPFLTISELVLAPQSLVESWRPRNIPLVLELGSFTTSSHWVLTKTSIFSAPLFHNLLSKKLYFFLKISQEASI